MGKKKEYKKPLLADADDDDDASSGDDMFGTLKGNNEIDDYDEGEAQAFASQNFASFDDEDEHDDIGESFRSASSSGNENSNHKRVSRTRTTQRRSMRNLTHSPGGLSTSQRSTTRRSDRARSDRKLAASPGAVSRKSATTSPGALSRHSIAGTRGASNSPHHLRRGPRARRRSVDTSPGNSGHGGGNSGHDDRALEKDSGSQQSSRRKVGGNKSVSPGSMGTSMRMLYSGHASADELATPDLEDQESDHDEFAEDREEDYADDAKLVEDELADMEELIKAAKGVGVS